MVTLLLAAVLLGFFPSAVIAHQPTARIFDVCLKEFPDISVLFRVDARREAGIIPEEIICTFARTVEVSVSADRDPAQLIFTADASTSMLDRWEDILNLSALFRDRIRERDRAWIYAFAERKIHISSMDRRDYDIRSTLSELSPGGPTHLYDSLAYIARQVSSEGYAHRFILLLSDGKDQIGPHTLSRASRLTAEQSARELADAELSVISISLSPADNTRALGLISDVTDGTVEVFHKDRSMDDVFRFIRARTGFSNLVSFGDPYIQPGPRTMEISLVHAGQRTGWVIPFHSDDTNIALNAPTRVTGGISWRPTHLAGAGDSRRLYIRGVDTQGANVRLRDNDVTMMIHAPGDGQMRGHPKELTVGLVLDTSGSMTDDYSAAIKAFRHIYNNLDSDVQILPFHFSARLSAIDSHDPPEAIGRIKPAGPTALYDSLANAASAVWRSNTRAAIVIITDGKDQVTTESRIQFSRLSIERVINIFKGYDMPIFAVSVSNDTAHAVMRRLSRLTGGSYYWLNSPDIQIEQAVNDVNNILLSARPHNMEVLLKWPCLDRQPLLLKIDAITRAGNASCFALLEPR